MNESSEIRYCKKCNCELMSTNKKKLCANCRKEKISNIRNGALLFGAVITTLVTGGAISAFRKNGDKDK